MPTIEVPDLPAPVAVSLDPAATALLVFDMSDALCATVPDCRRTVPIVRSLIDRAREAGAPVIFSLGRAPQTVLAALDRRAAEPVVRSGADKFFRTELEQHLRGCSFALMAGTSSNGSIVYTALACCARGITVVVAEDAISSKRPLAYFVARWQLLNQPGYPNETNTPLAPSAVTLSRSDLVTLTRRRPAG